MPQSSTDQPVADRAAFTPAALVNEAIECVEKLSAKLMGDCQEGGKGSEAWDLASFESFSELRTAHDSLHSLKRRIEAKLPA